MNRLTQSQTGFLLATLMSGLLIIPYETGALHLEMLPALHASGPVQRLVLRKDGKSVVITHKSWIELASGAVGRFSQVIEEKIILETKSGEILAVEVSDVVQISTLKPNPLIIGYVAGLIGFWVALKGTEEIANHEDEGGGYIGVTPFTYKNRYYPERALPVGVVAGVLGGAAAYRIGKASIYKAGPGEWELMIQ